MYTVSMIKVPKESGFNNRTALILTNTDAALFKKTVRLCFYV